MPYFLRYDEKEKAIKVNTIKELLCLTKLDCYISEIEFYKNSRKDEYVYDFVYKDYSDGTGIVESIYGFVDEVPKYFSIEHEIRKLKKLDKYHEKYTEQAKIVYSLLSDDEKIVLCFLFRNGPSNNKAVIDCLTPILIKNNLVCKVFLNHKVLGLALSELGGNLCSYGASVYDELHK